jgi:hypothetical protein
VKRLSILSASRGQPYLDGRWLPIDCAVSGSFTDSILAPMMFYGLEASFRIRDRCEAKNSSWGP